jgi:hypothetical protein
MCRWLTIGVFSLVAMVVAPASGDEPPTATAKAVSAWEYPGSKNSMSSQVGPLYNSVRTTTDDLASVVAHYEKKLGTKIAVDKPEVGAGEGGSGKQTAVFQDSLQPGGDAKKPDARDVTVLLASQNTRAYCLTLVISRAKGERHTHIALTYVSKQE